MNNQTIEQEIQAKGLTAPRVTPEDIKVNIVGEYYFTAQDGVDAQYSHGAPQHQSLALLTFCVLVLRNGFTVTGESACASLDNFDFDRAKNIARERAVIKIRVMMAHELSCRLVAGEL